LRGATASTHVGGPLPRSGYNAPVSSAPSGAASREHSPVNNKSGPLSQPWIGAASREHSPVNSRSGPLSQPLSLASREHSPVNTRSGPLSQPLSPVSPGSTKPGSYVSNVPNATRATPAKAVGPFREPSPSNQGPLARGASPNNMLTRVRRAPSANSSAQECSASSPKDQAMDNGRHNHSAPSSSINSFVPTKPPGSECPAFGTAAGRTSSQQFRPVHRPDMSPSCSFRDLSPVSPGAGLRGSNVASVPAAVLLPGAGNRDVSHSSPSQRWRSGRQSSPILRQVSDCNVGAFADETMLSVGEAESRPLGRPIVSDMGLRPHHQVARGSSSPSPIRMQSVYRPSSVAWTRGDGRPRPMG